MSEPDTIFRLAAVSCSLRARVASAVSAPSPSGVTMAQPSARSFTMPAGIITVGLIAGALILTASGAQGAPAPAAVAAPAAAPMSDSTDIGAPVFGNSGDIYMAIATIPGEVVSKTYKDQIEVKSVQFGAESQVSTDGRTLSKATPEPVTITKLVDKATTPLMSRMLSGKTMASIVLTFTRAGGGEGAQISYLKVTLTDAAVSRVHYGFDASTTQQIESLSLVYKAIKVEYLQRNDVGAVIPQPAVTWDLSKGLVS